MLPRALTANVDGSRAGPARIDPARASIEAPSRNVAMKHVIRACPQTGNESVRVTRLRYSIAFPDLIAPDADLFAKFSSYPLTQEQSKPRLRHVSHAGGCPVHLVFLLLQCKHGLFLRRELDVWQELSILLDLATIFELSLISAHPDTSVACSSSLLTRCSSGDDGVVDPSTTTPKGGASICTPSGIGQCAEAGMDSATMRWCAGFETCVHW